MNLKQLLILGVTVAAVSKFYSGNTTKASLIIGGVAIVAAAVSDNIVSTS